MATPPVRAADRLVAAFHRADTRITRWMADWGVRLLRISVGIVFFWFGVLKFFPQLSPAERLALDTIGVLTFGLVPAEPGLFVLAVWECAVGLGLILGVFLRIVLLLLFLQMLGTVAPVFLFPDRVFTFPPFAPTIEGQYIIKNLVLVSAGLVIGATVRGGRLVAEPDAEGAGGRSPGADPRGSS